MARSDARRGAAGSLSGTIGKAPPPDFVVLTSPRLRPGEPAMGAAAAQRQARPLPKGHQPPGLLLPAYAPRAASGTGAASPGLSRPQEPVSKHPGPRPGGQPLPRGGRPGEAAATKLALVRPRPRPRGWGKLTVAVAGDLGHDCGSTGKAGSRSGASLGARMGRGARLQGSTVLAGARRRCARARLPGQARRTSGLRPIPPAQRPPPRSDARRALTSCPATRRARVLWVP